MLRIYTYNLTGHVPSVVQNLVKYVLLPTASVPLNPNIFVFLYTHRMSFYEWCISSGLLVAVFLLLFYNAESVEPAAELSVPSPVVLPWICPLKSIIS